jgi:hypothetical protein
LARSSRTCNWSLRRRLPPSFVTRSCFFLYDRMIAGSLRLDTACIPACKNVPPLGIMLRFHRAKQRAAQFPI